MSNFLTPLISNDGREHQFNLEATNLSGSKMDIIGNNSSTSLSSESSDEVLNSMAPSHTKDARTVLGEATESSRLVPLGSVNSVKSQYTTFSRLAEVIYDDVFNSDKTSSEIIINASSTAHKVADQLENYGLAMSQFSDILQDLTKGETGVSRFLDKASDLTSKIQVERKWLDSTNPVYLAYYALNRILHDKIKSSNLAKDMINITNTDKTWIIKSIKSDVTSTLSRASDGIDRKYGTWSNAWSFRNQKHLVDLNNEYTRPNAKDIDNSKSGISADDNSEQLLKLNKLDKVTQMENGYAADYYGYEKEGAWRAKTNEEFSSLKNSGKYKSVLVNPESGKYTDYVADTLDKYFNLYKEALDTVRSTEYSTITIGSRPSYIDGTGSGMSHTDPKFGAAYNTIGNVFKNMNARSDYFWDIQVKRNSSLPAFPYTNQYDYHSGIGVNDNDWVHLPAMSIKFSDIEPAGSDTTKLPRNYGSYNLASGISVPTTMSIKLLDSDKQMISQWWKNYLYATVGNPMKVLPIKDRAYQVHIYVMTSRFDVIYERTFAIIPKVDNNRYSSAESISNVIDSDIDCTIIGIGKELETEISKNFVSPFRAKPMIPKINNSKSD